MNQQTYEQPKVSEELHRFALENTLDPIFITDDEGRFRFISPNVPHILGYSIEEIEAMGAISKLFRGSLFDLTDLAAHGEIKNIEAEITDKDGENHLCLVTVKRISIYGGTVLYVCRDITESKRAEEELQTSEKRFRKLFDRAPISIWDEDFSAVGHWLEGLRASGVHDLDAFLQAEPKQIEHALKLVRLMNVNETTLRMFEVHSKEELLRLWPSLFTDETFRVFAEELRAIWESRNQVDLECSAQTAQGRPIHYNLHWVAPLENGRMNLKRVIVALVDTTDRKQAEKQKEKLEIQLIQAQKMEAIGILAGGIAHDFNNVLGIIVGNLELAADDIRQDNPAQLSLNEARKACLRAKDMVKQILAFSRQETNELRPIDIQPIVKEIMKMLRASIPATIEIQQDISTKNAMIMGDPTQIHQVIMNLCTNASDAMDEMGSTLQIRLASVELDKDVEKELPELTHGRYIRLTVSDTGHGIKPEILGKIFDPYFTTKEIGKGTGMGLAVVHGIVRDHGGAITVYSEEGKGTTFDVFFPELERKYDTTEIVKETIPRGTERILFVDDEVSLAKLGKRILEGLGYTVESRTSSIEALEAFHKTPKKYDLVITDMTMPNMTGEILAKELMEIRNDIPVILCTGFSHRIDDEKARSEGIRGFVMKPLVRAELAKTVRQVLDDK